MQMQKMIEELIEKVTSVVESDEGVRRAFRRLFTTISEEPAQEASQPDESVALNAPDQQPSDGDNNFVLHDEHTDVLFVDDGVACLERVRRKREGAPSLDSLNQTERVIINVLKDGKHLTGEEIATVASCKCNSHFKATLAALVKFGVIKNDQTGYFMS